MVKKQSKKINKDKMFTEGLRETIMLNINEMIGWYKRTESFRIAHIRKLPVGSKMSENAKMEAKKAGFSYIEDGYTFVRANNLDKEPTEKKIIKIHS